MILPLTLFAFYLNRGSLIKDLHISYTVDWSWEHNWISNQGRKHFKMFLIGYFGRERSINTKHINKNISHHLKENSSLNNLNTEQSVPSSAVHCKLYEQSTRIKICGFYKCHKLILFAYKIDLCDLKLKLENFSLYFS